MGGTTMHLFLQGAKTECLDSKQRVKYVVFWRFEMLWVVCFFNTIKLLESVMKTKQVISSEGLMSCRMKP